MAEVPSSLSIREVSQHSGCSPATLRYYETEGLIAALPRPATAARRYSPQVIAALEVIVALRGVGFGIQDIRKLMGVKRPGEHLELRLARTLSVLDDFEAVLRERRSALQQAEALLGRWREELRQVSPVSDAPSEKSP